MRGRDHKGERGEHFQKHRRSGNNGKHSVWGSDDQLQSGFSCYQFVTGSAYKPNWVSIGQSRCELKLENTRLGVSLFDAQREWVTIGECTSDIGRWMSIVEAGE